MRYSYRQIGMRVFALMLLLIGAAGSALGGIVSSDSAPAAAPQSQSIPSTAHQSFIGSSFIDLNALLSGSPQDTWGLSESATPLPKPAAAPSKAEQTTLRELPPAPSSMSLVLSALATLGAYQGARSVKRIHLNFSPEWYHTGGPAQIGHATPYDLDCSALPVCRFEAPVARPVFAYRIPRELSSRLRSQYFLPVEAPRGPPTRIYII